MVACCREAVLLSSAKVWPSPAFLNLKSNLAFSKNFFIFKSLFSGTDHTKRNRGSYLLDETIRHIN